MSDTRRQWLPCGALLIVGCIIIGGNIWNWNRSFHTYHALVPAPESALQEFFQRSNYSGDRNWQLYGFIEKHYRGWTLVSFTPEPARASQMYDFDYGGIRNVRIARYDPRLTRAEAENLSKLRHLSAPVLRRIDGQKKPAKKMYVVPFPPSHSRDKRAIVLIHEDRRFIVPVSLAPERFSEVR